MILARVFYELFEHELERFQAPAESGWHQLDGQIRFDFLDSPSLFISWVSDPLQYSIGFGSTSHFKPDALAHTIEMTDNAIWAPISNSNIQIAFTGPHHQILKVSSAVAHVFLSAQYDDGMFQGDCIRVSQTEPTYVAV